MEAINKTTHIPLFKIGEEVLIAPQVTNEKEWLKGVVVDIEDNPFVGFVITAKTKELGEFFLYKHPPAPFKGGDGTVNIQEYHNCISY